MVHRRGPSDRHRVFETHALLLHRSRPGRETALKFLDALQTDTYDVVRVRKNDEEKAVALIRAHEDNYIRFATLSALWSWSACESTRRLLFAATLRVIAAH